MKNKLIRPVHGQYFAQAKCIEPYGHHIFWNMKFIIFIACLIFLTRNFAQENFFVIVIPSYNNKEWYQNNLNSVLNQTYKNYKAIYIDDCSPDNTGQFVEDYIKEHDKENKITLIKNSQRKGALENLYNANHTCKPSDIIVCLDGDDWLANDSVLEKLNNVYSDSSTWLTYGQFQEYPNGNIGCCTDIPKEIFNTNELRKHSWVTSHLRSFYAGLFHKIKKEDLMHEGQFYPMAWDAAIMYPMIEMAGNKHIRFINEVLYIYNVQNQLNDNKVNKDLQCKLFTQIRSKNPYEKINGFLDKKFVILIPSYNNSKHYKENLDSVLSQTYKNYRIVYVDDNSSDGTAHLVENYIKENKAENTFTLVKNKKRELALANIYKSVINCDDNEIIVLLDGDDWFAHKNVLYLLNYYYKNEDIWITYGNFTYLSNGQPCSWTHPIPEQVLNNNEFRNYPHGLTHLRTFYAWLFKQIKIEDLYHEADFFKMTYDVAILLPMIEMANKRHKLMNSILYIYNDLNPMNDHVVNKDLQHDLNRMIRQKNRYSRLNESQENFLNKYTVQKTDVIIFAYELENLKNLLSNTNQAGRIIVVHDFQNNDFIKNNPKIIFLDKRKLNEANISKLLAFYINNKNPYLYITNDTYLNHIPDFKCLIETLELTKANAFYYFESNKILQSMIDNKLIEVIDKTYSFEFEDYTLSPYVSSVFLRKKDLTNSHNYTNLLSSFELEWKYLGWKKICLLTQVGNSNEAK